MDHTCAMRCLIPSPQTSIQIRILKQVLSAERQRQADTAALLDSINHNFQGSQPIPIASSAHPRAISAAPTNRLLLTMEPDAIEDQDDSQHILAQLQAVTARQNERDMVYNAADLHELIRAAPQRNSDAEMIRVLQVGRDEMFEALKTLQHALEKGGRTRDFGGDHPCSPQRRCRRCDWRAADRPVGPFQAYPLRNGA